MMRTGLSCKIIWLASLAALLFTGGCGSSPQVEFYTLNSTSNVSKMANAVDADHLLTIGVGPVAIPEILDRPQIVTRTGPNKLQIDEFHRWAGRLDEDFARVLAVNISRLLDTEQVAVYPWDVSFEPFYQVTLDIRNFEGRWGQEVFLEVFWKVIDPQKKTTLHAKKSVIKEPLPDKDYASLVSIKSRIIGTLSQKIAQEIQTLESECKDDEECR